jgi:hypothetical protein
LTSFEDAFVSDWNDVAVYGRMDPISTFQGTKRQINFGFDVIASDINEAMGNFEMSRKLIQNLYPVYEEIGSGEFSATSIQAPPLIRIRFANLISEGSGQNAEGGLVGKIGGLSFAPDMDAGFFTSAGQILPKVNRFACNFTVLHTERLGWDDHAGSRSNIWNRFPYPTTETGMEGTFGAVQPESGAAEGAVGEGGVDPFADQLGPQDTSELEGIRARIAHRQVLGQLGRQTTARRELRRTNPELYEQVQGSFPPAGVARGAPGQYREIDSTGAVVESDWEPPNQP